MTTEATPTTPTTNPLTTQKRISELGIDNVNANLMSWKAVEGAPGNYLKVLTIDRARHRVDFLFKQDLHAEFTRHTHRCTAVALTLEGRWGYREGAEEHFPGTWSYEPPGTTHTPFASEEGMTVYASFIADDDTFLDLLDPDGNVVGQIGLDFFEGFLEK
ncbi:MAG TPA: cupin domain-containing protein [Polyangiaceae bacterium LLY-WYZ-14_1]|nr:cupin domain-containing protein [Polyangiaceae bacterium LLY-WYZ-14_1]